MVRAKQINGFPNYYITDTGNAYSRFGRFRKLKPMKNRHGYLAVRVYKNNKQTYKLISRLVAEAFIPNPKNKPQVNHKNGVRIDNRVENLEWATCSENVRHSYHVLGRTANKFWAGKFGKENPRSKATQQIKNGTVVAEFCSVKEAAEKTGLNKASIAMCCRGLYKSAGGYKWQYTK